MVLIPCENSIHGCSAWFGALFGMKVHARSCIYRNVPRKKKMKSTTVSRNLQASDGNEFRLTCDKAAFDIGKSSSSLDIMASPKLNLMSISSSEISSNRDQSFTEEGTGTIVPRTEFSQARMLKLKLGKLGRQTARRDIDEILSILRDPLLNLDDFLKEFKNYNDCLLEETRSSGEFLADLGFEKVKVSDPLTKVSCYIYRRSPIQVLRKQIERASGRSTFFDPIEESEGSNYCHPMMGELGKYGVKAVSMEIISHSSHNVVWNNSHHSSQPSFVGMIQLYSDKSKTSLKESAFQFYPIHMTLMNFSEEYRRHCIVSGDTFLAFLPIAYFRNDSSNIPSCIGIDRAQKLRLLHLCMSTCMKEIIDASYSGFLCIDKEGRRRRCHPCVASYCSDLPEAKDLTSVRNGNRGVRNCHRFLARTASFNEYTKADSRKSSMTVDIIGSGAKQKNRGQRERACEILDEYSLGEQIPCSASFPFIGIHPALDIHSIFQFEPLHGFHLGVSRELKRCMADRLRSKCLTTGTNSSKDIGSRDTMFKTNRMQVLNGVNRMLTHIQTTAQAKGLRIDFSSTSKCGGGNGLYNEQGNIAGMLEAKDHKMLDMVSPFIGMFVDRCCSEVSTAKTTNVFVQYVKIVQTSLSYDGNVMWNESRIKQLENMILKFKEDATELYFDHQASNMSTEKFHGLDHICQDLRRMGGIRYGDAGLFEYSHTKVKQAFRAGSKRRRGAMDEMMVLFMKDMSYKQIERMQASPICSNTNNIDCNLVKKSTTSQKARTNDCPTLVMRGVKLELQEFYRVRRMKRNYRKALKSKEETNINNCRAIMCTLDKVALQLFEDIGEYGSRVLQSQLRNQLQKLSELAPSNNYNVFRVNSASVPGIRTPTSQDYNNQQDKIRFPRSTSRRCMRVVSGRGFYRNNELCQDCVLLEAEEKRESQTMNLWVGKVLNLLRIQSTASQAIRSNDELSGGSGSQGNQDQNKADEEFIFIQYFDVMKLRDKIDETLGCIRLKWACSQPSEQNEANFTRKEESFGKWFDLLPASAIRGMVHVVRGDYGVDGVGIKKNADLVPWYKQWFYINMYYYDPDQKYYEHEQP